jgi:hypothetical protein
MDRQIDLILASFEYQNKFTCAELEELHYPSTIFPQKIDIQVTLNRMVTHGILELVSGSKDMYRKAL